MFIRFRVYLNPPEPTFFVGSSINSILGFIIRTYKALKSTIALTALTQRAQHPLIREST